MEESGYVLALAMDMRGAGSACAFDTVSFRGPDHSDIIYRTVVNTNGAEHAFRLKMTPAWESDILILGDAVLLALQQVSKRPLSRSTTEIVRRPTTSTSASTACASCKSNHFFTCLEAITPSSLGHTRLADLCLLAIPWLSAWQFVTRLRPWYEFPRTSWPSRH